MKKHCSYVLVLGALTIVFGCAMQDSEDEYSIGDTGPAGGVIFYIDEADAFPWTYLECAPKPEVVGEEEGGDEALYWSTYVGLIGPEAQGTAIGTGEANTQAIIAKGGDGAAKYCSDFVLNGYDDWFLPSRTSSTRFTKFSSTTVTP